LLFGAQVGVTARKAGWVYNSAKAPLHLQCEYLQSKPSKHAGGRPTTGVVTGSGGMTGGTVGTSCTPSLHGRKSFGL